MYSLKLNCSSDWPAHCPPRSTGECFNANYSSEINGISKAISQASITCLNTETTIWCIANYLGFIWPAQDNISKTLSVQQQQQQLLGKETTTVKCALMHQEMDVQRSLRSELYYVALGVAGWIADGTRGSEGGPRLRV